LKIKAIVFLGSADLVLKQLS